MEQITYHSVTFSGSGAGAAQGNATSVAHGSDYTLTLKKQTGYSYQVSYKMGGKPAVKLFHDGDGIHYTVVNVTAPLEIIIEKTLNIQLSVHEFVTLDEKSVFLILADAVIGSGNIFTYDGNAMYYSEAYGAWAYLVVTDGKLDQNSIRSLVKITAQTDRTMTYSGYDVDRNGFVDWNDVQLVQDLYNAQYEAFDTIHMSKFLNADVNGDRRVDVRDAARVVWAILESEEERT